MPGQPHTIGEEKGEGESIARATNWIAAAAAAAGGEGGTGFAFTAHHSRTVRACWKGDAALS